MAATKFLYVKGNRNDGRVALSEIDDAHPGGSVFVAHRLVRKVAATPFVREKLHDESIVETDDAAEMESADEFLNDLLRSESEGVSASGVVSEKYGDMSQKELADEAKARGLTFKGKVNKNTVIASLEADDAAKSSGMAGAPTTINPAASASPAPPADAGDVPAEGDAATHGA